MSEWKKVKLGDCCLKIGSGSTPKGGSTVYVESGTSFIRSQNVYNLSFDYNGLTHITEEAANKLKGVTVFDEDILLNITGDSVARTCIVPNDVLPARVNQHVAIVRVDRKKMNGRFLNYYLASPRMQAYMLSLAVGKGASRNAMTKQMIENFEVPCPPLDTQQRIATILSYYDSLIENYQKQIKLLEESAQRLYKEWFIDLRFPGHENTKIVDGVPEGWEKKKITELLEIKYGKDHKALKDGIYPVYGTGGVMRYTERYLHNGESVLIPRKGSLNNILLVNGKFWTIDTMFYSIPKMDFVSKIAYFNLKEKDMYSFNIGAAVPSMTINILSTMDILLPSVNIRKDFENVLSKYFSLTLNLQTQIRHLTEARDRLLPKLMSGEIEV
ncbi:MAG: restriction endonuclease subunit S [Bacteroidaceae bacterium]|nr:restriction endonuclease subunit S [Bacteroidaceae bacterium]